MSEKVIVGAGLSGLVAALSLARSGHRVRIFEKRTEEELLQRESGRSINLTLSERGLSALERLGFSTDGVRRLGVPAVARCVHYPDGSEVPVPYGSRGEAIYSVGRSEMLRHWFELARRDARIDMHFSVSNVSWLDEGGMLRVRAIEHDGRVLDGTATHLLGADGVNSEVRRRLEAAGVFRVVHERFSYGYKELVLTAANASRLRLATSAIHAWPRPGIVLMAFPNRDGSFRAILFVPERGPSSLESIATLDGARRVLEDCLGPTGQALAPQWAEELIRRPAGWLSEVRCSPWVHGGRIALLGDAAHAMLPFYGQGINSIFEDCEVLCRSLELHAGDPERALREYWESRKPDTDAIAELSRINFAELRDRPLSSDYALQRQIEARLLATFPRRFARIYEMVAFSSVPYRQVLARYHWQEGIVAALAAMSWKDDGGAGFSGAVLEVLERQGDHPEPHDVHPRPAWHPPAVDAALRADLRADRRSPLAALGQKEP